MGVLYESQPKREYGRVFVWNHDLIWSESGYAEKGAIFTTVHKGIGKKHGLIRSKNRI